MAYAKSAEALAALRTLRRREPNGQPQRQTTRLARREETEAKIMATARNAPHRRHAKNPDEPKLGDGLGRLLIEGAITVDQYATGEKYKGHQERYARDCLDAKLRIPPQTLDGGGGRSCSAEVPQEVTDALKREQAAIDAALEATGESRSLQRALGLVVVLGDYPLRDDTRGDLRTALNVLGRLWR